MQDKNNLKSRLITEYIGEEKNLYEEWKSSILSQINMKIIKGTSMIYENQETCSMEIVAKLINSLIISVLVIALTQSGKTGTMVALIKNYLKNKLIPEDNIYIITALNSCEWKQQTKERMPNDIQKKVFHRGNLKKFIDDVKDKNDVLIIIDEIQIAAKEKQSLFTSFKELGFYDRQTLLSKNIKIVQFTATPDGIIYDLNEWGEHSCTLKMTPGQGYTSCFDLLNKNRIRQFKDLCCYDKIKEKVNYKNLEENMVDFLKDFNSFKKYLYHIIRVKNGNMADIMIDNFKRILNDNKIIYKEYIQESDMKDINTLLKQKPEYHTVIFIKEKLRCAKTLEHEYLGLLYERYAISLDDATIIQGLLGRATGYKDNGISIIYTNVDTIERYKELYQNNFNSKDIKWNSKTTTIKNKILRSKGTYNSTKFINGMKDNFDDLDEEPIVKRFKLRRNKTFEHVKKYVKLKLNNKCGPNNPDKNINKDGFYECTVRKTKKVWSSKDMFIERKCNIKNGAGYGFRYCYKDINDKSTLEFWIIHYKKNKESESNKDNITI